MSEWEDFVGKLAYRYRGGHVYYEIENEVNSPGFWSGTLEEYLELLKASYRSIKKNDPHSKVLLSAMACGIIFNLETEAAREEAKKRYDTWLHSILSTRAFDIVSVHDYYFPSEIIANGLTFTSYLEHTYGLMEETGVQSKPIWITETGYVSRPTMTGGRTDAGSPEKQALRLVQAYHQAFEFGVKRVFWLFIKDQDSPYFGSMGLFDAQKRGENPRPAWKALHRHRQKKRRRPGK